MSVFRRVINPSGWAPGCSHFAMEEIWHGLWRKSSCLSEGHHVKLAVRPRGWLHHPQCGPSCSVSQKDGMDSPVLGGTRAAHLRSEERTQPIITVHITQKPDPPLTCRQGCFPSANWRGGLGILWSLLYADSPTLSGMSSFWRQVFPPISAPAFSGHLYLNLEITLSPVVWWTFWPEIGENQLWKIEKILVLSLEGHCHST